MSETTLRIEDRPDINRYEVAIGEHVAFLAYRRRDDHVVLVHTEVPEPLRERGLGGMLAKHALDEARRDGQQVVVRCPFVTSWLKRHTEYDDIVIAKVPESNPADQPPREPR